MSHILPVYRAMLVDVCVSLGHMTAGGLVELDTVALDQK
jgi:hypothetical protein